MKKVVGIFVAVVLAVILLIFATKNNKRLKEESQHSVPEVFLTPVTSRQASPDPCGLSRPDAGTLSTNQAIEIVGMLLHIAPGRLTTREAHQLVKDLIILPDFDQVIHPLLSSEVLSDRLLAVYAALEKDGFTPEIKDIALADSSPYVRAEIVAWLFKRQQFDQLDQLLLEMGDRLQEHDASSFVVAAMGSPVLGVPAALSLLDIGEWLPLYLTLQVKTSPSLLHEAVNALADDKTPVAGKKLLVQVLATARPPDYESILWKQFESEKALAPKIILAKHIAALTSQSNTDVRDKLTGWKTAGMHPISLEFREQLQAQRGDVEDALCVGLKNRPTNTLQIYSYAKSYLELGCLLGRENLSGDVLRLIIKSAADGTVVLPDDIIADVADSARRVH